LGIFKINYQSNQNVITMKLKDLFKKKEVTTVYEKIVKTTLEVEDVEKEKKKEKDALGKVAPKAIGIMYNREYTPDRITELKQNEIFVFGSNLAGAHGGGAARLAYERFGAVWGQGVGLQGQSYAIPTMQGGVETIKPYVDEFIRIAKTRPDLKFYVTQIGCGIAGFNVEEIAPLFQDAMRIENIILPKVFVVVLRSSQTGIVYLNI
jgi:hypothetical protein